LRAGLTCGVFGPSRPGARYNHRSRTRGWPLSDLQAEESPSTTEPRWWVTPTVPAGLPAGTGKVPQKIYRPEFYRGVRVKRCGKSAPRRLRGRRQGKPHRVQGQVAVPAPWASEAWFRPTTAGRPLSRTSGKSPVARSGRDKWPSPPSCLPGPRARQNSAYSASGWAFSSSLPLDVTR